MQHKSDLTNSTVQSVWCKLAKRTNTWLMQIVISDVLGNYIIYRQHFIKILTLDRFQRFFIIWNDVWRKFLSKFFYYLLKNCKCMLYWRFFQMVSSIVLSHTSIITSLLKFCLQSKCFRQCKVCNAKVTSVLLWWKAHIRLVQQPYKNS